MTTEVFVRDTLFSVIKYLSARDLSRLIQTSKQIYRCYQRIENVIWSFILERDFTQRSIGYGLEKKDRKALYQELYIRKSCNQHQFSSEDAPDVYELIKNGEYKEAAEDYRVSKNAISLITKFIKTKIDEGKNVISGDIIRFTQIIYHVGTFIWTGNEAIELHIYGVAPRQFKYPEYPPIYFMDSMAYNDIIYLEDKACESLIDNYNDDTRRSILYDYIRDIITTIDFSWEKKACHTDFIRSPDIIRNYLANKIRFYREDDFEGHLVVILDRKIYSHLEDDQL